MNSLTILFSINGLVRKYQKFSESKVMYLQVLLCLISNILFSVISKRERRQVLTMKKL